MLSVLMILISGQLLANDPQIIGGRLIKGEDVPYMVTLRQNGRGFCTGAMTTEFAVTAAHCLRGDIGSVTVDFPTDNVRYKIDQYKIPKQRGDGTDTTRDIAILYLTPQPSKFKKNFPTYPDRKTCEDKLKMDDKDVTYKFYGKSNYSKSSGSYDESMRELAILRKQTEKEYEKILKKKKYKNVLGVLRKWRKDGKGRDLTQYGDSNSLLEIASETVFQCSISFLGAVMAIEKEPFPRWDRSVNEWSAQALRSKVMRRCRDSDEKINSYVRNIKSLLKQYKVSKKTIRSIIKSGLFDEITELSKNAVNIHRKKHELIIKRHNFNFKDTGEFEIRPDVRRVSDLSSNNPKSTIFEKDHLNQALISELVAKGLKDSIVFASPETPGKPGSKNPEYGNTVGGDSGGILEFGNVVFGISQATAELWRLPRLKALRMAQFGLSNKSDRNYTRYYAGVKQGYKYRSTGATTVVLRSPYATNEMKQLAKQILELDKTHSKLVLGNSPDKKEKIKANKLEVNKKVMDLQAQIKRITDNVPNIQVFTETCNYPLETVSDNKLWQTHTVSKKKKKKTVKGG